MQVDTLLTQNTRILIREENMVKEYKDDTLLYSSLEESYFSALTQSFTVSILSYRLF